MHGLIFISFRDYLAAIHAGTSHEVFKDEPVYLVSEAYTDERFAALVERACSATGLEHDKLLEDFGVFTAERTFVRLYPAIFAMYPSTRAFLLNVEKPIHELVRLAIPQALPPALAVSELGETGVSIVYTSPRRLCALLHGLVEGTARHYREKALIDEQACMNRGDEACTLEVQFTGRAPLGANSSTGVHRASAPR